jgi:C4-dicarboxylate-specific signal transduction histidine kinase
VRADKDQIVQVVVNLVKNAVEAVKETPGARVRVTLDLPHADVVDVTVEDNGPGISAQIAGRLFEPYATTKPDGTGLGLAIAQRIAIEHNGELSALDAAPWARLAATGAIFRLRLPVAGPPPTPDDPGLTPAPSEEPHA